MRWWSLFGTALTLGASLCLFVRFHYDTLEAQEVLPGMPNFEENRPKASLDYRELRQEVHSRLVVPWPA